MGFETVIPAALCALAVAAQGAVAQCTAGDIEKAMSDAGLQDTYELFQSRDVIDAILDGTGLTILAPSFEYTSANPDEQQFTISEVDGVLDDGVYTEVLKRGVLTDLFTYEDFAAVAPVGSPASTDNDFFVIETLDEEVSATLWFVSEDIMQLFFRSYFFDDPFERVGLVNMLNEEAIDICDGMYYLYAVTGPLLTQGESNTIEAALAESPAK